MRCTVRNKWMQIIKTIVTPLLACQLLVSCASLLGPRQVELPLTRLQEGLERRFPLNHRIAFLDVVLARPQLTLLAENARVSLAMDATVSSPFVARSWNANLAMSGRLALDAAHNVILISDTRIDRLVIDGVNEERQRQFALVGNLVQEQMVKETPLYSFRPEDLRFGGVQYAPTKINMTATAVVVTFEPAK